MSVSESIVEDLRGDILTGRLESGQALPLDELASRFGTSVIPIRDALRMLTAARLVVLRPHRTARVADFSLAEIEDLYRVRVLLDPEAFRLAHGNLTAEALESMRDQIEAMEKAANAGDDQEVIRLHSAIHFRAYRASGSEVLVGILEDLWDQSERYRNALRNYRGTISSWVDEHRRLADLLENGTADEARVEMQAHVTRTRDALLAARVKPQRHQH